jgi:hypothetical protein
MYISELIIISVYLVCINKNFARPLLWRKQAYLQSKMADVTLMHSELHVFYLEW